jgi:hypothetical protein
MTFVVFLTFAMGAIASIGVVRAADRHRRWTLALVERRRRRVADALRALDREWWQTPGDRPPAATPILDARAKASDGPRRIVLRVRE